MQRSVSTTASRPSGTRRSYGQPCPVADALDLVGERWTLLVVRDLLFGPLRFTDLRDGLPGLAPNLLSERLRFLAEQGLVEKRQIDPDHPRTVYVLTPRGRELGPLVHALARFGAATWTDVHHRPPPRRLLRGALLALMRPERLGASGWTALLALPDGPVGLLVARADDDLDPLARLRLSDPPTVDDPHVVVTADLATLVAVGRGEASPAGAVAEGAMAVEGRPAAVRELARLLGWPRPSPGEWSARPG